MVKYSDKYNKEGKNLLHQGWSKTGDSTRDGTILPGTEDFPLYKNSKSESKERRTV